MRNNKKNCLVYYTFSLESMKRQLGDRRVLNNDPSGSIRLLIFISNWLRTYLTNQFEKWFISLKEIIILTIVRKTCNFKPVSIIFLKKNLVTFIYIIIKFFNLKWYNSERDFIIKINLCKFFFYFSGWRRECFLCWWFIIWVWNWSKWRSWISSSK